MTLETSHRNAALGPDPIATIGRDELKAKLDRGEDFKLVMALNRWAFDAKPNWHCAPTRRALC